MESTPMNQPSAKEPAMHASNTQTEMILCVFARFFLRVDCLRGAFVFWGRPGFPSGLRGALL
jgi:hypothetical protein